MQQAQRSNGLIQQNGIPALDQVKTLLIDLMRTSEGGASREIALLNPSDLSRLRVLAQAHRCGPLLARATDNGSVLARAQQRGLAVAREAARISSLLSEAGIAHCFLKGLALAHLAYPLPGLRPMRDLDVLIAPTDLARAHALLVSKGGTMAQFADRPVLTSETAKHLPPIHSPDQIIPVELHDRVLSADDRIAPGARQALEAALWSRLRHFPLGRTDVPVPSSAVLLMHLVLHGVHEHELDLGPLYIADIVYLLRYDPPNRSETRALASLLSIDRALRITARLLNPPEAARLADLTGFAPDAAHARPTREELQALLTLPPEGRTDFKLQVDLAQVPVRGRASLFLRRALKGPTVMRARWIEHHGGRRRAPRGLALVAWFYGLRLRQMLKTTRTTPPHARAALLALRDGLDPR
tara:strand:- start:5219 stop:6457 length:1239 start_codon:yes stop_codon:yes gene_type:complete